MIMSAARPSIFSGNLLPQFSASSAVTAPSPSLVFFNRALCRRLRRARSGFVPLSQKPSTFTTRVVQGIGTWEEPYDGSDKSDWEEDEDFTVAAYVTTPSYGSNESDWEEDKEVAAGVATASYEEDLVKEVEQLLEPEELAILQQNVTPNLDKISTAKWSPLHTLGLSGQIPYMDALLESGVDIDAVNKDGLTALHLAVIGKKEAVVSHLLRKGANPHVRDRDGATPLHYAVQVGALQTVKLLIKYEVDVNVADNDGWTPLHIAIQSRNRDISKILLVKGADRTRRTKDGSTPLDLSFCYGKEKDFKSYELAKLLKRVPAYGDLR